MKLGDMVRIRECDPIPEVVGEHAEVIDLQIQPYEKYRQYPIWAKMISGEHEGRVYGFHEGEVELLPTVGGARVKSREQEVKAMRPKIIEQMEEILKGVTTAEEIEEVETIIAEAKGKILPQPVMGFWEGKTPCWEMFRCPEAVRNECPSFKYSSRPCWEIEGTYCKLNDYGTTGRDTSICEVCRVYKKWGHGEPIEMKLFGRGIDTSLASSMKKGD